MNAPTTLVVDDIVVVALHGVMQFAEQGKALEGVIAEQISRGRRRFVIDLEDVPRFSNINYGPFGSLITVYKDILKVGGVLRLAGMTKRVDDLFHLVKLHTVFDIRPDTAAAIAAFGEMRPTLTKAVLAIIPTADGRLRIEVLERLDTAAVAETSSGASALSTIWLPASSFFSDAEIAQFEQLINAEPPAKENEFQAFFEAHPKWLYMLGEQYEAAVPHATLPPIEFDQTLALTAQPADRLTMIPDFLLKRVGLDLWDVLDLKLPSTKAIVGRDSRRRFSQEVADAVAQLREYDRRLRTSEVRRRLLKEHNVSIGEPLPMVLVGRDFHFEGSQVEKDRFRESDGVRVYTYDDLYRLAKQRRLAIGH